jgi:excisionase family DNA binding protein
MTARTDPERLALRPAEAARLLGVSGRTLWSWTSRGLIPFIRINRTILYPYSALKEWLDQKARATAGEVQKTCVDQPATDRHSAGLALKSKAEDQDLL